MNQFPCTQCGLCCQHVNLSEKTAYLDSGNGVCRHYNQESKLCDIYDNRPSVCRVDHQYSKNYKDKYSWNDFVVINLKACEMLQSNKSISLKDKL